MDISAHPSIMAIIYVSSVWPPPLCLVLVVDLPGRKAKESADECHEDATPDKEIFVCRFIVGHLNTYASKPEAATDKRDTEKQEQRNQDRTHDYLLLSAYSWSAPHHLQVLEPSASRQPQFGQRCFPGGILSMMSGEGGC